MKEQAPEITLSQLLDARDNRQRRQRQLLQEHSSGTLVVATVVMPGPCKRNEDSLIIARAAVKAIVATFGEAIMWSEQSDLNTGFEGYFVIDVDVQEAKKLCVEIEESHPLGRLFDIDVISSDGIPMPREAVGAKQRACLLCGDDARLCMRKHTHSCEELLKEIHRMTNEYIQRHKD